MEPETGAIMLGHSNFEHLVAEILRANNFEVVDYTKGHNSGFDFEIKLNEKKAIVEVKMQRQRLARVDLVRRACQQLVFAHKLNSKSIPLLIISSEVKQSFKRDMLNNYGVLIWDTIELFRLSFDHANLYYRLEEILYKLFGETSHLGDFFINNMDEANQIIQNFLTIDSKPKEDKDSIVSLEGKTHCRELKLIDSASTDFVKFEKKCTEILKYLFNSDLELWQEQNQTEDSLHRFDLLCRLRPSGKNFWDEILHDFNSRYVVFEFKNYKDQIKQGQIYTTEKYLYRTALRSIAILIAKNDGDKNAYKAAGGALKEVGKLIVILSANDLCKMLDMKDLGNDPTDLLRNKIDTLLTKMSR